MKGEKFIVHNIFRVKGKIKPIALIIFSTLPLLGALFVSYINRNAMQVYNVLEKPSFSPPPLVFMIIWFILYILMGIAAYRIYMIRELGGDIGDSLFFFFIQLLLNYLWFFIFFSFRLYGIAFIEAKIMLVLLIITFVKFLRIDKIAGILLIPLILWIMYANILNFLIWVNNEM